MLIRIINGTYGHSPKLPDGRTSPYVVPVNRKSGPIDVEKKEAARLVEAGVAEYVTEAPAAKAQKATEPVETAPHGEELTGTALEDMSFTELKAYAKELGIETGKIKSKENMIEAISAFAQTGIPADDGEDQVPTMEAQDVVD